MVTEVKISELPAASSANATMQFETNDSGTSKRVTGDQLKTFALTDPSYTGTLTGSTGVINIGSGQIYKDTSGNVGIGTSSPGVYGKLDVLGAGYTAISARSSDALGVTGIMAANASSELRLGTISNHPVALFANDAERMRIASNGQLSAVVPGGTTLYPSFTCRAWVNFDGTGTVAIRGSGNVSSITDVGVGSHKVNLTTALPDLNCSVVRSDDAYNMGAAYTSAPSTTSSILIDTYSPIGTSPWYQFYDCYVYVAIFR